MTIARHLATVTLILLTCDVFVLAQQTQTQAAMDEMVKVYLDAWTDPNPSRRRELLEQVLTPEATYTDPNGHTENREALVQRITRAHQKFPGMKILPTSHADFHHDVVRFTWRMVSAEGKTIYEGIDFCDFTPERKIRKIVGFFGPLKTL